MKIAVTISEGPQSTIEGMRQHYRDVDYDHDFAGSGDVDVTDCETLEFMYNEDRADYQRYRRGLKLWVADIGGFDLLTTEQKEHVATEHAVSRVDRDKVHTVDEQIITGRIFHEKAIASRQDRIRRAEAECANRLDEAHLTTCISYFVNFSIDYNFVHFGLEGVLEGNDSGNGLFDWIEARAGTLFDPTGDYPGLAVMPFPVIGMAGCNELSVRLMEIVKEGKHLI